MQRKRYLGAGIPSLIVDVGAFKKSPYAFSFDEEAWWIGLWGVRSLSLFADRVTRFRSG